jgi:hypothetical protein
VPPFSDAQLRTALRDLVALRNDAYRQALLSQTQYRNLLLITAGILLAVAAAVPFVAAACDARLVTLGASVDGAPVEEVGAADIAEAEDAVDAPVEVAWRQLLTIELWGAFGGAIGALVAVRRLRGHSTPLSMGVAQVAIKLPAGALVALFIVLALQAGVVTELEVVSANQLAAYAAVFGFAEEVATRWADRKASELIGQTADVALTT